MKRLLTVVSGLSLIAGFTFAQMRDVPPGHWAYEAIEQLVRDGIIEGYPDGTFRPNRVMSRAEFAQAIARAYRNISERLQALSRRIDEISGRPLQQGGGQQQPATDEQARRDIQALRNEINELKKLNDALQTLQRLAQTFQQELANLGVDVDSLKKEVASLRDRVAALETKKGGFTISGDVTFGVAGVHSDANKGATTLNGNNVVGATGLLYTLSVYHEMGLTFSGQVNEEVSGVATFLVGNYLGAVGDVAQVGRGAPGNTDVTIWEAYVKAPIDLFGAKVDLTVGRFPAQLTPYTLKRVKPDYYLDFPRYDDGAYRVDGATAAFNFDTFRLNLWAAQSNAINSTAGPFSSLPFYNHNSATSRPADQFAGARLEFDAVRGEETNLTVGATYFAAGIGTGQNFNFAGSPVANNIDRVDVFGADIKAKFAGFKIGAEYAQSNFMRGTSNVLNNDNWALNFNLGYDLSENLGITAGYQEIRPYFASPGYWGRVGYLYNPSDLRGPYADISWKASKDLSVRVSGAFFEGTERVTGGYTKNDELVLAVAGVDYRLSDRWEVSLNYEGVFFKLSSGQKPVWNYVTLGLGYNLGENATWNLLYQIIANDGKGAPAPFSGGPNANKNQAGVAATTLSIKF